MLLLEELVLQKDKNVCFSWKNYLKKKKLFSQKSCYYILQKVKNVCFLGRVVIKKKKIKMFVFSIDLLLQKAKSVCFLGRVIITKKKKKIKMFVSLRRIVITTWNEIIKGEASVKTNWSYTNRPHMLLKTWKW